MKKHETYQRACQNRDLHGFEGPIKVSFGNYTYPIMQDFLRATESQGIPTTDDLQDLVTGHGAEHWLKWINRDTGRRSDSAHGYIHSTRAVHQNLHLVCNTKVDKVIIENGRAVGVQTVPTKPLTPGQNTTKIYRARKQIIISGGTLSSPLILQRSGVGMFIYSCRRCAWFVVTNIKKNQVIQRNSARPVSNPLLTFRASVSTSKTITSPFQFSVRNQTLSPSTTLFVVMLLRRRPCLISGT
jgi:choline dehydrogenase-like flavoprotein